MAILDFFQKFDTIIHIQLWKDRIRITKNNSDDVFEFEPVIAFEMQKNKDGRILAIGREALGHMGGDVQIKRPLSHPRVLIDDYKIMELIIEYAMNEAMNKRMFFSPKVIMEPMEEYADGLTVTEYKILYEVALNAGAREVVVKDGDRIIGKENFSSL